MKKLIVFVFVLIISNLVVGQENPVVIKTRNTSLYIPEGIATDEANNDIYVTSIAERKIIIVKKDGSHRDFISPGAAGFGEGLGIKIDNKRNWIWAVSNKPGAKGFISQLHAFDKKSGKVMMQFSQTDTANLLFNDIAIDEAGNIFITSTNSASIYYANTKTKEISVWLRDTTLTWPNGIVLHNNKLYIATYSHGVQVCDRDSKKLQSLQGYQNKKYAFNFDGLGFYKNTLWGVYNGEGSGNTENGLVAYLLTEDGRSVKEEKPLLIGHPTYYEPTTLSIANGVLYVISNSHLAFYNANKESVKGIESKLLPVTLLAYDLKKAGW